MMLKIVQIGILANLKVSTIIHLYLYRILADNPIVSKDLGSNLIFSFPNLNILKSLFMIVSPLYRTRAVV